MLAQTYRIKNVIASSELSNVYTASRLKGKETCIIKEFYPQQLVMRDLDRRTVVCRRPSWKEKYHDLLALFWQEAELVKELRHEHIVGYVNHFAENGTGYLVLQYCEGKTLNQYLEENEGALPPDFLEKSLLPLLDGILYIHGKGIIHRDIKPASILIGKNGQPTLIDFGSAIFYEREKARPIFTTRGFSPLEFYSEKSKQGIASDIYSLAALLGGHITSRLPPCRTLFFREIRQLRPDIGMRILFPQRSL